MDQPPINFLPGTQTTILDAYYREFDVAFAAYQERGKCKTQMMTICSALFAVFAGLFSKQMLGYKFLFYLPPLIIGLFTIYMYHDHKHIVARNCMRIAEAKIHRLLGRRDAFSYYSNYKIMMSRKRLIQTLNLLLGIPTVIAIIVTPYVGALNYGFEKATALAFSALWLIVAVTVVVVNVLATKGTKREFIRLVSEAEDVETSKPNQASETTR